MEDIYDFYIKRVENALTVVFIILFLLSFKESFLSLYSIIFYVLGAICVLYYFIFFKKRTTYVIITENTVAVASGFFFKMEQIRKDAIKKVNVLDNKIELIYSKDGLENRANIFNLLLEDAKRKTLADRLKNIAQG